MSYATYITQGTQVKCTATFPAYSDGTPHRGQDLVIFTNPPYLGSVIDGTVIRSEYGTGGNASFGNFVMVQEVSGKCVLMAHFKSRSVTVGQKVKKGDILGIMGATGNVTGAHVHVEYHQTPWGQLIDPSIVTGIPNIVGVYETVYAGGDTPTPPDPVSKDWLLTLCKVKFTSGAERCYPCTSANGFVYFYDDGMVRCQYNDFTKAEKWLNGYWNTVDIIASGNLGVFDVSSLLITEY